jgi:hypothetical protein
MISAQTEPNLAQQAFQLPGVRRFPMQMIKVTIGPFEFIAKMEEKGAPKTCAEFCKLLPYKSQVIHVRWSGESIWIPLGDFKLKVDYENHTSHPARGDILFYPGGISETEILIAYGSTCFSSKMGQLAGNHFMTLVDGRENLGNLGRLVLWKGAQDIIFEKTGR